MQSVSLEIELGEDVAKTHSPDALNTGGIEKFSSKGNFRKILKVSHFYLGFS